MKEKLTKQEINYLLNLLEGTKRHYIVRDIEIASASLSETEIYFLQQKLEKLR